MLDVTRQPGQTGQSGQTVRTIRQFIAGAFVEAQSGRVFDKNSPVTGALIARVSEAGQPEVDAAVKAYRCVLRMMSLRSCQRSAI
jgi:acyl-CoA reductase-like NAD-dependent aldehyde dehydrogenase